MIDKLVKRISDFKRYAASYFQGVDEKNNPLLVFWNDSPLKPKWRPVAVMLSEMTGVDFKKNPEKILSMVKGKKIVELTAEFIRTHPFEEADEIFKRYGIDFEREFYEKVREELTNIAPLDGKGEKAEEEDGERKEKPEETPSEEPEEERAPETDGVSGEEMPLPVPSKPPREEKFPRRVPLESDAFKNRVVVDYGQILIRYYVFDENRIGHRLNMDARISVVDPYTSCTVIKGAFYRLWGSDDLCRNGMEAPIDIVNPEDLSIFVPMIYAQAKWLFGELGNFDLGNDPEIVFCNDYYAVAEDPDGKYSVGDFFESGQAEFYGDYEWVVKPRYRMATAHNVRTGEVRKLREFGLDAIAKKMEAYDYNLFIRRFLEKIGKSEYEERVKEKLGSDSVAFLY